jgi:hypothetical protein
MFRAALLALTLSGCGLYQSIVGPPPVVEPYDDAYSRAEVDAINAEIACRNQARTPIQAQRCGIRR